jgi:hypothetical protein
MSRARMETVPVDKKDLPMSGHPRAGRDDAGTTVAKHLDLIKRSEGMLRAMGHNQGQCNECLACALVKELRDELANWEVKRREAEDTL